MKKVWLTVLLSTLITFTCACGTSKQTADDLDDLGTISNKKVEATVSESAISEVPEEEEKETDADKKKESDYTGFYAFYPDDINQTCHEVNITAQDGNMITFDYNFYNTRTANGTEVLTEPVLNNMVKFSAPIYGGHGADGQISNLQFEFKDENTLILRNRDSNDEWTLVRQGDAKEHSENASAEEKTQDSSGGADSSNDVYPDGYAPSKSGAIPTNDIIGEYTSDNGNVYSVNFYTSGEDERVGIIYLNRDEFGGNPEEKPEIVGSDQPNVYPVYGASAAFVFDYDGSNCVMSYYKDGKLWDKAVMTKKYQPS